jgi:hypothetical protein
MDERTQCPITAKQHIKIKVLISRTTMATVILSHTAQNPLTANDHYTKETVAPT